MPDADNNLGGSLEMMTSREALTVLCSQSESEKSYRQCSRQFE